MDFLQDLLDAVVSAAASVWPAVLGAALGGYVCYQWLGALGFWGGAAAGAIAGIWGADRIGLRKVKGPASRKPTEILVSAAGGFALVAAVYLLLQFFYLVVVVAVVAAVAVFALGLLGNR